MNLLRQPNYYCYTLKNCRLNFYSLSSSFDPWHREYANNRFRHIDAWTKTKTTPINVLSKFLRNENRCEIFRQYSTENVTPVSENGLLSGLKQNINPYARLVRFDRPIGKYLKKKNSLNFKSNGGILIDLILSESKKKKKKDRGCCFGHAVGVLH